MGEAKIMTAAGAAPSVQELSVTGHAQRHSSRVRLMPANPLTEVASGASMTAIFETCANKCNNDLMSTAMDFIRKTFLPDTHSIDLHTTPNKVQ